MATFSKLVLSSSIDGKNIQLGTTLQPIHSSSASGLDEIWIWGTNISSATVSVTIAFGSSSAADYISSSLAPNDGPTLLIPGWVLQNQKAVGAFASAASAVNINGFINRAV